MRFSYFMFGIAFCNLLFTAFHKYMCTHGCYDKACVIAVAGFLFTAWACWVKERI